MMPRSLGSQISPMYEYAGPSVKPKPKPIVSVDVYSIVTELAYQSIIQPTMLGTQAMMTHAFLP